MELPGNRQFSSTRDVAGESYREPKPLLWVSNLLRFLLAGAKNESHTQQQ